MAMTVFLFAVAIALGAVGLGVLILMILPRKKEPRGFPIEPLKKQ